MWADIHEYAYTVYIHKFYYNDGEYIISTIYTICIFNTIWMLHNDFLMHHGNAYINNIYIYIYIYSICILNTICMFHNE